MHSPFRVPDKVINLRDPTVRACLFAYFPPALFTILLLAILIVCSVASTAVNGCYKQQLYGRQQDLLLNCSEINILLLSEQNGEFRSKLQPVAKFIYKRYGRFIRTQLNFEISVSQQWDDDKFATELVDRLEEISQNPLVVHQEYRVSCTTLRESITRQPNQGDSKQLRLHLIGQELMGCATHFLNMTSTPILAVMVENFDSGLDVISISNIASHQHF